MPRPPITPNPSDADQAQVLAWLCEYNHANNGEFMTSLAAGAQQEFFLVARDEAGAVIGGIRGAVLHKWLKIELMAVRPDRRGEGIGRALAREAERVGVEHGCDRVYVDSMTHQGPGFYMKLGFTEVGRLQDWDSHGHDKVLFAKTL